LRLLVTGASGLLGTKICQLGICKGFEVYSGYWQHKPRKGIPLKLDLSQKNKMGKIFDEVKPDAVVHAAAMTNVDKCELEKNLSWRINVEGTQAIVKLCKKHRSFMVYVSTDYVFNGDRGMYTETDQVNPINYYGLTKLKGEESVRNIIRQACIARTSVIFGSIPATGKTNFALWLLDKLKKKKKVQIVTDQTNSPTLNTNLAEMILEVLERKLCGTYHLAGGTRLSRYQFAITLAEIFDLDTSLIDPCTSDEISWVAKRPKDSSLNIDKAMQTLEFKPMAIYDAMEKVRTSGALFSC
jgi:dTDP-4-dehydrorhamnose reductase